ncbi:hypothetical protein [Mycoplasmopsis gallopavonis]|uniref:DUF3899 domain-containing protein n=1 Tax=Mycoplasmopsis gallopavonis TaxID=76629 RepID=A0A449AZW7_9BACT|nr:hypothetical protein [Mycoplasmopsis gallopavonis]RIV16470.1 hypothetical protein D1113_02220 [Mycoplasmopsis gallopavonis]VEU73089.1 Uncharacterised protein [Mycoplasmopsis gallopavonis]
MKFSNWLKAKLKYEFTTKRFYIIVSSFLLFWLILFLLVLFLGYKPEDRLKNLVDIIGYSSFIVFLIDLLILVFRWGFLKRFRSNFSNNIADARKAKKESQLKKLSPQEKAMYLKLEQEKIAKKQEKDEKNTHFPYYFVLALFFLILAPFIIIGIVIYSNLKT